MKKFYYFVVCLIVLSQCIGCQKREKQQTTATNQPTVETSQQAEPTSDFATSDIGQISLARNFYFIFDGSGSMRDALSSDCGGDQTFKRKLEGAKWAVAEFLKKVPEDVNLGLYVFDENHRNRSEREVVPLGTNNMAAFLQAINAIEAGGGTPLAEAIRFGAEVLARQREQQLGYGEFRLIVVTDGLADDIPQAAEFATENAIPIYAIGLCIKEDHPLRQYAVSYRAADNFEDLAKALEATVVETEFYDAKTFEALTGHMTESKQ
ncbi:VWA domain-containing protein [candidate division KSB1 bacterium]|nr:VWA domain-containing protein [candidate division KSB1 bacterium]